jgi:hypothetical protein
MKFFMKAKQAILKTRTAVPQSGMEKTILLGVLLNAQNKICATVY